jgi:hypothetical protein
MSRTGPLTIHDTVEIVRIRRVGRFHTHPWSAADFPVLQINRQDANQP